MAYTYRNKKTGEVIYLNQKAKSAFWEEVESEETPEEETPEEETPKKSNGRRGKKQ